VPSSPDSPTRSLRGRLAPGGRLRLIAAVAGGVVVLDAITKWVATSYLAGHDRIEILGGLVQFQFYRNFAGPNNIFPGHTELISLFAIVAVAALLVVAMRVVTTTSAVAVGLLLGGAIGNLLDRLLREPGPLRGGVVDWLRFTDQTKSMNIADLAIDAAIAVMLVGVILAWWRERQASDDRTAPGEAPSPDQVPKPSERPYG
jgi:signal peptidase II